MCRHCGRKAGHQPGCTRPRGCVGRPRGITPAKAATVEEAREWFRRFGFKDDCISPTGRRMFEALLRAVREKAK